MNGIGEFSGFMKRKFVYILWHSFLVLFLLVSQAWAEDISVTAEVDRRSFELGSFCQLRITVRGGKKVSPVELPKIEGMESRYLGPSTSITVLNGAYSSSKSFQYNLYPLDEGRYEIPALNVIVDGQSFSTDPIYLEVTAATGPPGAARLKGPKDSLQDKIFLTLSLPKREYYLNEGIPVTAKLYVQKLRIRNVHYPDLAHRGFSVKDFKSALQSTEILGGLKYDVLTFQTEAFPTREGDLTLGPASLSCDILFKNSSSRSAFGPMDSIFNDSFFQGLFSDYTQETIAVKSADLKIKILPLPDAGRPQSFSGAVGTFDFQVTVTPASVKVGDPLTIRTTLKGQGNLNAVQMPVFESQAHFKFYDPQITEDKGVKTVEQVAIPTSDTVKEFPAITFSYFDTQSQKYRTVTRGPFPIDIVKLEEGEKLKIVGLSPTSMPIQVEEETLGEDILFIKAQPGHFYPGNKLFLYQRTSFWVSLGVFLILWSGLLGYYHFYRKLTTDTKFARRFHAPRAAREGMKLAQSYLEKDNNRLFYDTLFKTVQNYFGHKFHIPQGAVTIEAILSVLKEKGAPEDVLGNIKNVYAECEQVRYASLKKEKQQMLDSYDRVMRLIELIEKNWT